MDVLSNNNLSCLPNSKQIDWNHICRPTIFLDRSNYFIVVKLNIEAYIVFPNFVLFDYSKISICVQATSFCYVSCVFVCVTIIGFPFVLKLRTSVMFSVCVFHAFISYIYGLWE